MARQFHHQLRCPFRSYFHLDVGYRNCHDDPLCRQRWHHHLERHFHPNEIFSNLGQFVSRTKFIRGDGTNPLFLHGILVNMTGLLSLIGIIHRLHAIPIVDRFRQHHGHHHVQFGTIFIILWFIDRFLRNGSEMGQGLYDLVFGAYLVKYVPSDDEKATGIWARLENMGNFGDQLLKRQEERKAKKEEKEANTEKETNPQED